MTRREPAVLPLGLLNLLAVYIVWSSTYLAIRLAVREGSGFPPFTMAAMRIGIAGLLLLLFALAIRARVRLSHQELIALTVSAVLLWLGGNGLVSWAEQRAHSGYAALLIASTPIWVAAMEIFVNRRAPSRRLVMALLVGLVGVGLLTAPAILAGANADGASAVALLLAAVSWGVGSLYQKRQALQVGVVAAAGYQSVIGGVVLLIVAILTGEPVPNPTTEAWLAWGYLLVFSSLVAFPAYVQVLRLLPMSIGMTYAYVTPVGAVLLGWWLLGEPITIFTVAGAVLVLAGVAGVFREQLRGASPGRHDRALMKEATLEEIEQLQQAIDANDLERIDRVDG